MAHLSPKFCILTLLIAWAPPTSTRWHIGHNWKRGASTWPMQQSCIAVVLYVDVKDLWTMKSHRILGETKFWWTSVIWTCMDVAFWGNSLFPIWGMRCWNTIRWCMSIILESSCVSIMDGKLVQAVFPRYHTKSIYIYIIVLLYDMHFICSCASIFLVCLCVCVFLDATPNSLSGPTMRKPHKSLVLQLQCWIAT